MKLIFKKGFWYQFSIWPDDFIYVLENKSLAGKEDRHYDNEAIGRRLAVTFFEVLRGDVVHRVDRGTSGLSPQLLTVAEIIRTCGFALDPDPSRTSAEAEILLEMQYLHVVLKRFVGTPEPQEDDVHVYSLSDEVEAEAVVALEMSQ